MTNTHLCGRMFEPVVVRYALWGFSIYASTPSNRRSTLSLQPALLRRGPRRAAYQWIQCRIDGGHLKEGCRKAAKGSSFLRALGAEGEPAGSRGLSAET